MRRAIFAFVMTLGLPLAASATGGNEMATSAAASIPALTGNPHQSASASRSTYIIAQSPRSQRDCDALIRSGGQVAC
jgi:hypothetical protein